ncbi:MAG: MipA/OmpV family protein [Candidatus Omnitrophota bacterium]
MIKKIMISVSVVFILSGLACHDSFAGDTPDMIGLGAVIRDEAYKGMDTDIVPVPILFWENKRFFVRGSETGLIVWEEGDIEIDTIFKPRFMGYDDKDSATLNGMQDRDFSLDGGMQAIWTMRDFYDIEISASFVTDLLSEHEGEEATISLSKTLDLTPLFIKPSLNIDWQSEGLVGYYYGVKSNEVVAGRPEYSPSSAVNISPALDVYLALSKEWLIFSRIGASFLDNEIKDSPIVDEDYTITGVVGLAWMF